MISSISRMMNEFEFFLFIDHPCICKIDGVNTNEILKNESQNDEAVITTVALFLEYLNFDLKDCLAKECLQTQSRLKYPLKLPMECSTFTTKASFIAI